MLEAFFMVYRESMSLVIVEGKKKISAMCAIKSRVFFWVVSYAQFSTTKFFEIFT